jgi:hypothetical protein
MDAAASTQPPPPPALATPVAPADALILPPTSQQQQQGAGLTVVLPQEPPELRYDPRGRAHVPKRVKPPWRCLVTTGFVSWGRRSRVRRLIRRRRRRRARARPQAHLAPGDRSGPSFTHCLRPAAPVRTFSRVPVSAQRPLLSRPRPRRRRRPCPSRASAAASAARRRRRRGM